MASAGAVSNNNARQRESPKEVRFLTFNRRLSNSRRVKSELQSESEGNRSGNSEHHELSWGSITVSSGYHRANQALLAWSLPE